jgi:Gas vesicle protein
VELDDDGKLLGFERGRRYNRAQAEVGQVSSRELAHRSGGQAPTQLPDVLERILDKGIVIAADMQVNLLDIELLTVKLRLLVASADKAREVGID